MADHHHGTAAHALERRDPGQKVQGAFRQIVGLPVIQALRGDVPGEEFLSHVLVDPRARTAKPSPGAAYPYHALGGIGRAVQDSV